MMPSLGIEPKPHWCEAFSALTTRPTLTPISIKTMTIHNAETERTWIHSGTGQDCLPVGIVNPFTAVGAQALIDFTLSNTRRFYSSMGIPLAVKGLTTSKPVSPFNNPLTTVGAQRALIDFTLSNARRFYSSMGNALAVKGLKIVT